MRLFLRRLLTLWGRRGPYWDMLGVRFPGRTKALKVGLVQLRAREALVRIQIIDLDDPMKVLDDLGVFTLEKTESGEKWQAIGLDCSTVRDGEPKEL